MMHPYIRALRALLLTAALAATPAAAVWANRPALPQVTGQVTGLNGNAAVTIDGQTYLISSSSQAYQTILSVHVGDHIGLILNGPAGAATTQVVGIVTATTTTTSASH